MIVWMNLVTVFFPLEVNHNLFCLADIQREEIYFGPLYKVPHKLPVLHNTPNPCSVIRELLQVACLTVTLDV